MKICRVFYGMRLSHIFEIPSISNEKPSISIEILGISIQICFNLNLKCQVFRAKYPVFWKLGILTDYYVPWLFLFVANVWTVTKRGSTGLKKIAIQFWLCCNNYVTKILIILRIPSSLLFTLWITSSTVSVLY